MDTRKFVCAALCLLSFGQAIAGTELEEKLTRMRTSIALAKQEPTRENLLALGETAARTRMTRPRPTPEYQREWTDLLHQAMEIPGHAQVFVDELERRRELYGMPDEPRVAHFDSMRTTHFFRHLAVYQSPEAVKALGGLLHDFQDTVPDENRRVTGVVQENAYNAACALSIMGLRDPPLKPLLVPEALIYAPDLEGALGRVQEWWAKVESGEIPFSFVGQPVEYRFQSDGSVASTPFEISADERKRLEDTVREQQHPAEKPAEEADAQESSAPPARRSRWPWVVLAAGVSAVAFGFLKIRK